MAETIENGLPKDSDDVAPGDTPNSALAHTPGIPREPGDYHLHLAHMAIHLPIIGLMLVCLATVVYRTFALPIRAILSFTPDDSLFYYQIAWNFVETGRFTYDTIRDTYGYIKQNRISYVFGPGYTRSQGEFEFARLPESTYSVEWVPYPDFRLG